MKSVLITLQQGYGLGDAVQMSTVLRHVKRQLTDWSFDFRASAGQESVGRGIADNVFCYGDPYPRDRYDEEVQILLYDRWYSWMDRPNTRVSSALHERFGLDWDAECGGYQINVRDHVAREVSGILGRRCVGIHYQGDSAAENKNLTDEQAADVMHAVLRLGRFPLLIDWRNVSKLRGLRMVRSTGGYSFSQEWGRDAERNCAVIAQCEAFVGIDSGPGKCASATDTPSLIVWTGHHPAAFHDPAPNTTHLVPEGVHQMSPVSGDRAVIDWFDAHYITCSYRDDPVRWNQEVAQRGVSMNHEKQECVGYKNRLIRVGDYVSVPARSSDPAGGRVRAILPTSWPTTGNSPQSYSCLIEIYFGETQSMYTLVPSGECE